MIKQPRRSKVQRATPELILATARRVARQEGWPAVTIRRIAAELGYSSPLIYEHFPNKEAAFLEVLRQGFLSLETSLRDAVALTEDHTERLLALADAYWSFAQTQPEVYQIMHGMGGVVLDATETAKGANAVCDIALQAVAAWSIKMGVALPNPHEATKLLWCALHGVTCLGLVGRLDTPTHETQHHIRRITRELVAGWRSCYAVD